MKRLINEFRDCKKHFDNEILLLPNEENLYSWHAEIQGPPDTPFQDGVFDLEFEIPKEYPNKPPKVRFLTKIFHPNVHFKTGEVCLDVLKSNWSPVWTLHSLCRAIINLLTAPEADSPLNCDAGNMLRNKDDLGFYSVALMYTKLHAKKKTPISNLNQKQE